MCTICGHFARGNSIPSTDIYDMLKKMEHRGPDMHGAYLDGTVVRTGDLDGLRGATLWKSRVAMGHSRLSIVGADGGAQPYSSCDGALSLIHNGEIYNFGELRSFLKKNHTWQTPSDSEVIVHLLEECYDGDLLSSVRRILPLLDGMYALAVSNGKEIVAARDPIGKKPLYFIENGDITYFASEKKALWNGKDEPDRVKPAQILHLDAQGTRVTEGFPIPMPSIDIVDFSDAVARYRDALLSSVRKRLNGLRQGRLGVIFSGGIDSVLVAKLLQQEGRNIVCYCTGTSDSGDVQAALEVARDMGLPLRTTIIDERMVEELLPEVIRDVEECGLLQIEVAIPMYLAARMASEDGIRVMYTGQGADELWGGYPWYKGVIEEHGYLRLHERMWEDLNYLYTDTLEREDKLTMAHAIELRAPYLDSGVIRTAMRVSPRLKIQGMEDDLLKRVHRQAAVEMGVPAYLAFRVKDPAQSGSGIHSIIQKVAEGTGRKIDAAMARANQETDKGSLYRYDDHNQGNYGDAAARAYLQAIRERIKNQYIPRFLKVG